MGSASKISERMNKVVDAAAQLFARQGYHGTNTREIAQCANISENTLFRYFASKEDLFWNVLNSRLRGLELRRDLKSGILGREEPRVVLPLIIAQLVDTAILRPELIRLVAIAFIELHWKPETVVTQYLSPSFDAVNSYLAANIEKGKMRALNVTLLTAAIASSVILHPELEKLIGGAAQYVNRKETVHAYTKFWMELLVPSQSWPDYASSEPI
jgi:AcrR family transcriptional regulator